MVYDDCVSVCVSVCLFVYLSGFFWLVLGGGGGSAGSQFSVRAASRQVTRGMAWPPTVSIIYLRYTSTRLLPSPPASPAGSASEPQATYVRIKTRNGLCV